MHFDLLKIVQEMDVMARAVTIALLLMGVASLAVFIERSFAYSRSRRQSKIFASKAGALITDHRYTDAVQAGAKYPGSHLARALVPGLKLYAEYEKHGRRGENAIEAV